MATVTIRPNLNGDTMAWNAEGGDYTRVDEAVSDGDTTRLYTPTANAVGLFNLENPSETGNINSVTVYVVIRGLDPVSQGTQVGVKIGGTEYWSSTKTWNSTTYTTLSESWATNPNTSASWTWTNINDVQVGMKRISGGGQAVTQVYAIVDYTSATTEQEGFRWRNDDGSETTATWLASQDTNITRAKNTNTRLRILLNTTGDLESEQLRLEYKLSTDSLYTALVPDDYVSTVDESMVNTPSTGTIAGDAIHDDVNDYIRLTSATNFHSGRFIYSATLPTNFTTEFDLWAGGGTGADAIWFFFGNTSIPTQEDSATGGYSIAFSEFHDAIRIYWNGSQISSTSQANLDNSTWRTAKIVKTGDNFKIYLNNSLIVDFNDTTRTITGSNYGWAGRCGGSNNEHRIRNVLLYEGNKPGAITLASSANISAGGANTTAQLTAPSGKSTSDFVAGRIQDDENPSDAVDVTTDDYTEMEWCLKATNIATDGNIYQFKMTKNGIDLHTYTVTPQLTIGTASAFIPRIMLMGTG